MVGIYNKNWKLKNHSLYHTGKQSSKKSCLIASISVATFVERSRFEEDVRRVRTLKTTPAKWRASLGDKGSSAAVSCKLCALSYWWGIPGDTKQRSHAFCWFLFGWKAAMGSNRGEKPFFLGKNRRKAQPQCHHLPSLGAGLVEPRAGGQNPTVPGRPTLLASLLSYMVSTDPIQFV